MARQKGGKGIKYIRTNKLHDNYVYIEKSIQLISIKITDNNKIWYNIIQ